MTARLILHLLGARALRRMARILVVAGALWMLLGALILIDLGDGELSVVMDTLGVLFVIEGAVDVFAAIVAGVVRERWRLARGVAFLVAGFLVADIPWDNNIGSTVLFGTAFLADGLFRIGSALLVRGERWPLRVAVGALELGVAASIWIGWPVSHRWTIPLCIAMLLLTSGYALIAYALRLRHRRERAARPAASWPVTDVKLILHVWTATGSAEGGADGPRVVRRYIAAVDGKGNISTGHAALELPPDLYISHYPQREIEHDPDSFRSLLDSGPQNDVPGKFQPSYAEEMAGWCPADGEVRFSRYNAAALRRFWATYSRDTTYNLTRRNCSSTVIAALDAATEGALGDGPPVLPFLRLLADPRIWLLATIRGRAEAMAWTPGLVLDYGRLLRRIIEVRSAGWRERLTEAWRTRRETAAERTAS